MIDTPRPKERDAHALQKLLEHLTHALALARHCPEITPDVCKCIARVEHEMQGETHGVVTAR